MLGNWYFMSKYLVLTVCDCCGFYLLNRILCSIVLSADSCEYRICKLLNLSFIHAVHFYTHVILFSFYVMQQRAEGAGGGPRHPTDGASKLTRQTILLGNTFLHENPRNYRFGPARVSETFLLVNT